MFFRQDSIYRKLELLSGSDPARFTVPDLRKTVVTIRPPTEQEVERLKDKQKGVTYGRDRAARVHAIAEFEPSEKIAAAFRALDERRLPDDTPPREEWPRKFDYITEKLQVEANYVVPGSALSESMKGFVRQTQEGLIAATRVVVGNVRWRLAYIGPHDPVQFLHAYWSLDAKSWHPMPSTTSVTIAKSEIPRIDRSRDAIQELVDAKAREPLGHALWHEASQQRATNPRSAILIGLAALEIGIKHYAINCVPYAAWLIEEIPSPPIEKLLTDFLPGLPPIDGGKAFEAPDEEVLAIIRKGVTIRNQVTHKGVTNLNSAPVAQVLSTVRSLLWQLDAAAGMDWAAEYAAAPAEEPEEIIVG
ncbi:MAG TPA: hypothetical protein VHI77_03715 [Solirubrobacterales bacterium]|jgi:hypothetical protein|nr:hypothetical protein [Solirubrobacterales bacterium]